MIWLWAGFIVFILAMLVIDLVVLHKPDDVVPVKQALGFTGFTILLAGGFTVLLFYMYSSGWLGLGRDAEGNVLIPLGAKAEGFHPGWRASGDFIQAWLLEYSLSVDNLFVFAVVFRHFRVPAAYQHRVLFWGIIGALVMRAVMIFAGVALIKAFEPILYVFGVFLIYTAFKLLRSTGEEEFEPEKSWLVKFARRVLPLSPKYEGSNFMTRAEGGARVFTPLFLVLLVVEGTDVVFAVDSIPAVFGVTKDPFLVFTSNVFAILGLRSLYFALAHIMDRFRFLKVSLAAVLAFVGVKMMIELPIPAWGYEGIHVPGALSLGFIVATLGLGVLMSWVIPAKPHAESPPAPEAPPPSP